MSEPGQHNDELLERIRATVAQRRASGLYPPTLEDDLDAHFQRIVATGRQAPQGAPVRQRIQSAREAAHFTPERIATSSSLPAGEALHKAMSRVFHRQANGILLQVQEFADRVLEALDALAVVADTPEGHVHSDVVETLDMHSETLAGLTAMAAPAPGGVPQGSVEDLVRRVAALEDAQAARRWRPWFGRERFEEVFDHGGRAARVALVIERLEARTPVFVVVSPEATGGRSAEVADLVATGVPPGPAGVSDGGLSELAQSADAAWGGIVALRADEVLTAQQVVDLVALAYDRLAAEGCLLVSVGSPAPASSPTGPASPPTGPASSPTGPASPSAPTPASPPGPASPPSGPRPRFDPTAGPSLPARYVAFACQEAGFASVDVEEWAPDGYLVVAAR